MTGKHRLLSWGSPSPGLVTGVPASQLCGLQAKECPHQHAARSPRCHLSVTSAVRRLGTRPLRRPWPVEAAARGKCGAPLGQQRSVPPPRRLPSALPAHLCSACRPPRSRTCRCTCRTAGCSGRWHRCGNGQCLPHTHLHLPGQRRTRKKRAGVSWASFEGHSPEAVSLYARAHLRSPHSPRNTLGIQMKPYCLRNNQTTATPPPLSLKRPSSV